MEEFDLQINLPQEVLDLTVMPVEIYDGKYPTYFCVRYKGTVIPIRLNKEDEWEQCEGSFLPGEHLNDIVEQILTAYRMSA